MKPRNLLWLVLFFILLVLFFLQLFVLLNGA